MMSYPRQDFFISNKRISLKSKGKHYYYPDQFFHLPTVFAENDPILSHLYSVVSFVLDDHPYPSTRDEFYERTFAIEQNVRDLNLSSRERNFLNRLMAETGVNLVDLWQGSHIIILDNGFLYDRWSKLSSARSRFSSHYRKIPLQQYGINFLDHQLLFGKTAINGSTWFQMEAHGFEPNEIFENPNLVIYHGQDFLKYRIHGMNVGPFGFSPHTEKMDPIILPYKPLQTKRNLKRNYFQRDQLIRTHFLNHRRIR